jgi:hypothetical protein
MKISLWLVMLVISIGTVLGQGEDNSLKGVPAKERIVTGGGFGMGFNNYQDYISVSPIIGYSLTRKLLGGVGLSYQYVNYKDVLPGQDVSTNNFGLSPFLRFNVFRGIFLQTEYEHLNYEFITYPSLETTRQSYNSFFAGGGYVQPIGRNAAFFIMALYNFSFETPRPGEYAPYYNPWVLRVGVNIGGFIF